MIHCYCLLQLDPKEGDTYREWLLYHDRSNLDYSEALQNSQNLIDRGMQEERRIIFVDDDEERLKKIEDLFQGENRATFFLMESPIQLELIAKKIAWKSVLQCLEVKGGTTDFWKEFSRKLEEVHLAAGLLLADSADLGTLQFKAKIGRGDRPVRNGLYLKGAFAGTPAIIVGAGPTLKDHLQTLHTLQENALIFSGGSALAALPFEPHFAGHIDPIAPYREAKRYAYGETPFFFQSRVSSENFSLIHGEAIWFPETHHTFLNWLDGIEEPFDGGWTVGTFLTQIAYFLGCDPIVIVGMDLCYADGAKYPHRPNDPIHTSLCTAETGETTQPDWLMARRWFEELSVQATDRQWIDARGGGLPFAGRFETVPLSTLKLHQKCNLRQQVYKAIHALPFLLPSEEKLREWEMSLKRCAEQAIFPNQGEEFKGEVVYDLLLSPLWKIFRPFFEQGMGQGEEIWLHRLIFFQRVIQEHLHAIEMELS
ncbi:MAG TPA: 6-hydroxymethylpterin diphosphokinase MptE-like protein [Chlamydiales bacterium]|nr:6-hydroxymethylpterin diphosphokinase MptE-like protein [Chlamydiales bacterium]